MNVLKKLAAILLICFILLSEIFTVTLPATAAQDVSLEGYNINKTTIKSGDEFSMTLNVKKYSADVSDIYIAIDSSSSFSIKNSGSIIPVDIATLDATVFMTNAYNYKYDGSSNKLQVTIKYTTPSGTNSQTDFVTISEAVIKDDTPSTPVDTTKYAPKIQIAENSAIPSGQAGAEITYTLPLKNTSLYYARNIVVSPVLDDSAPITVEAMNPSHTLESLQPNESKNVKFTFKISYGATPKTYPIKFNLQYYNASGDYFSNTETGYLKTLEGSRLPKLDLKTVSTNPSPVLPGKNFKLDVALENNGAISAKNVTVTLLGLKNDGASIIGNTNKKTQTAIYSGTSSVFSFNLFASSKIETGANSLKVKVDYSDSTGSLYSDEMEFFYNVVSEDSHTIVEMKSIVSPENVLSPGDSAPVSFDIANTGSADAHNIKVTISADKELIPRTQNTIIIPTLKKGESKNVQFQLYVSDEAVTKNYAVSLNVEYDAPVDGTVTKQTVMQYVGLNIENSTGKSVPRLIIDKYSVNPEIISAGQPFTLNLSILNTSKASTISNVKVTLTSDDGTFTTVNSNSFYIDSIAPKGRVQKQVSFSSKSDAAPKQYMISINYEYEDEKGNPYTTKDVVGVSLQQTPRLVVGDLSFPAEAYLGSPVPINVSFYNMGKSTLYNLLVKLEGNFRVEGTSYYVGNFEPGKTDSFDGAVTPEAAGPVNGFLVFSYEDADGKKQEVKKEISFNASEMPVEPPADGDGSIPPQEAGKQIPLWAFIGGGALLLIIITITVLVIRKKIKARKEFMIDEEL
ncbi:hypothetical protein LY28_01056 [Ruminiclostridium sufflavum DSM 19573]|uniref:CARDB domain-containing protein n=1 Tax=Ruminiclostridium sufflavum DSM 19573 TaxID=1121337 RepID=A0A318XLV9_9FIRM|nr:CARDB domain-containing protein [Ruminiclostridium sufflavum]PYG88702.1 hypothetical protein LY28_01056 [Ruminiclostridium sufflavum DSM 19573]